MKFFICTKCQAELPQTAFYKNRASATGFSARCMSCIYKKTLPILWAEWKRAGAKPCAVCKDTKPLTEFHHSKVGPLRRGYVCKTCCISRHRNRLLAGKSEAEKNRVRERFWRLEKKAAGLCTRCGEQPLFNKSSCKECWEKRNLDRLSATHRWRRLGRCYKCGDALAVNSTLCPKHLSMQSAASKEKTRVLRVKVIAFLGGVCVCCDESNPKFLTIDHSNNDGHKDKAMKRKDSLYRAILRDARPDIRLLCFNCNCGRATNGGVCPHEEVKQ